MRFLTIGLVLAALAVPQLGLAAARPFDVEDLVNLARVSDPQLAPDGRTVAYVLRETDRDGNRGVTGIWLAPADAAAAPIRLTAPTASAWHPRWAPDGRGLYFLSTRGGEAQVWRLPVAEAGEARQVTDYPVGVNAFAVSPRGDQLALSMDVFLDCEDLACTRARLDERAAEPATGVVHERVFVRHWDSWKDGRRAQLFLGELGEGGEAAAPRRVSVGLDADIPTRPFGSAEEWAFSPDGSELLFVARVAPEGEPWSTNTDVYRVAARDEPVLENLTAANLASDTSPAWSPDGRYIAWLAMSRPGFEADRYRIMLRDLRSGATREVAPEWDRSAHGLAFGPDGRSVFTWSDDLGHRRLFRVELRSGDTTVLSGDGSVAGFSVGRDGVAFARHDLAAPAQLFVTDVRGRGERQLTSHNAALLDEVAFGAYEQFSFAGAGGEKVYGWVVKPVGFEAGQRYPVAFIIHGGPQGSMGNSFHYRWNPQTYAGKGYAVVFIDFHGSTGYGQDFTDSISGDWGGKPLEDLQLGWAAALARYDFLDGERACALGASYGGYMINWIAGAWPDGFACLVNHSGIFDNRSMYYSTEELWFPEWEMGGPQFEAPGGFEHHNPVNLVAEWRTPMLVIHGAKDFRVPLEQGLATFNALQRRGIPSRFLYFPDENHWILKPANSVQWHRVVEAWLGQWIGGGGPEN
ncbi:S9 family peptidase [Thioalkalivibrio sp. XN279]|uniref:S9 family peptidase n=1 Tax=Thioalkalivibrio sp. XN279 TaxID=2714953 RepID=UPI00140E19F2|nr:S9 family peptidase [Thioalkalivibrio sp. XN279]NHA13622.1 S9 family peptidase [Thioalkalivibrio sp. XN279]